MKVKDLAADFDFTELLDSAEGEASTGWEQDFCADIRAKLGEYGDEMFISEAQLEKLKQIAKVM